MDKSIARTKREKERVLGRRERGADWSGHGKPELGNYSATKTTVRNKSERE